MRGIVTSDERQMIREKCGWECCGRCDSPIACAKNICCARFGDEGDNLGLDIPPERDRTDTHREDIYVAWLLADIPDGEHNLDSTEGHLAVLRGIQYGRKQERKALIAGRPSSESMCDLIGAIIQDETKYDPATNRWDTSKAALAIVAAFDAA